MQIPQAIRQQACEGLLHFVPKKALARELGISKGSVRDWAIYIEHGFFDWIDKPWRTRRPELMQKAVDFWFEHYPIGYSDVAKRFGIRPAAYPTGFFTAPSGRPVMIVAKSRKWRAELRALMSREPSSVTYL